MSTDPDILKIKKMLERIVNSGYTSVIQERLNQKEKEVWITGRWLSELTGWGHQQKRNARESGIVKYKKENGSYLYLLSSIPNEFKKIA